MMSDFFKTNGLTILSLVYLILILFLMLLKDNSKKITTKIFYCLLFFTILSCVLYIVWGIFVVNLSNLTYLIAKISVFFFEIWVFIFGLYMYIYISKYRNDTFLPKNTKINLTIILSVLVILNFVFCMILDYETVINGDGLYMMGGPLNSYCNILGFLVIVYAIILFLANTKKFERVVYFLTIPCVLIIGGSLILTSLGIIVLNDFTFRFAVLVMFLYLSMESQDAALLDEFNNSAKMAEESNKLKSEFIMNMSHQLRTPMNTILGFSDLILMDDNFDLNEAVNDTKNIKESSHKLIGLINSIVDMSKLEGNKEVVFNENYNLENIIYDISSNINSKLKENIMFTINADEICPNELIGDEYKLSKILKTIILNAINHTEYGEVSLNVSCIQVDSLNYEFTFLIRNSGHVMTYEDFNRSFEDLIKLSNDNKVDMNSDVLNLIIAKKLLELIGGSVEFVNETGKGTQYIIKLKQKLYGQNKLGNIKEKIQTKHVISHEIKNLLGKKVLIIDEDKVNTVILKRLLGQYNISIDISLNPRDGIDLVNNNNYDFIIVNHNMSDVSGEEVVRRLNSTGNRVPTIIGLANKIDDTRDIYNYVLNFPVEFKDFNKIINNMFNGGDL